jgi:hypothetical protein
MAREGGVSEWYYSIGHDIASAFPAIKIFLKDPGPLNNKKHV